MTKCTLLLAVIGWHLLADAAPAVDNTGPFTPPHFPLPTFRTATYNVRDFGAKGDGLSNDTPAINQAIEKCHAEGGGEVLFPPGTYAAASIHLKSHIRFNLDQDAVITGAASGYEAPEPNPYDRYQDYGHSHFHNALMWGENIEDFAIVGGKINGGHIVMGDRKDVGDKLVSICMGKNLAFENIVHEQGGHFVYLLDDCENITFTNVQIKKTRDSVDFMGCRNVQVTQCQFSGGDDCIGIKSDYALGRNIDSANFYVWDCDFASGCNPIQFGSETTSNFKNANFWNIRITRGNKAGIGITCNDGGIIDGANYDHITMEDVACPIYINLWDRLRTGQQGATIGAIRNVKFSNITIKGASNKPDIQTSVIAGMPGHPVENISFENMKFLYLGGHPDHMSDYAVPHLTDYSPKSFGPRPAWGFYISQAKGLTFKNLEFACENPDQRPAWTVQDADDLTLDQVIFQKMAGGETLRLDRVSGFTVQNSPGLKNRTAEKCEKTVE